MKLWSREATQKEVTITSGLQVSRVAYRAQLGRLGGSRWGWVLQIKCRAIQTNVLSLPPEKIGAAMIRLADRLV